MKIIKTQGIAIRSNDTSADDHVNGHQREQKFDEHDVLHKLKHFLPTQTPLKDFIHHNSLHAFQEMKFYDAIFKASKMFGFQVTLQLADFRELYNIGRIKKPVLERLLKEKKGEALVAEWLPRMLGKPYDTATHPRIGDLRSEWKRIFKTDLDNQIQPLLFRIVCSYLDQGIAMWQFPADGNGFLSSVRALEADSFSSFFKTRKVRELFLSGKTGLHDLLKMIVGDENYFEQYLFDQQFTHRGWSGMASAVEDQPQSLLDYRKISLKEFIIFELFLELDTISHLFKDNWKPLSHYLTRPPVNLFADHVQDELNEVLSLWQDAFEWSYYDEVLTGISQAEGPVHNTATPEFQAMFCIDERECSLRRHIEQTDPNCETFGTPGFFSVEFFFQPENGKFYDKLCPQPVTPKFLIKEFEVKGERKHDLLYSNKSHGFVAGFLLNFIMGTWSGIRLFLNLFKPVMSPAISNAFSHMRKESKLTIENDPAAPLENGLQVGFTIEEMAARAESLLRGIGMIKTFAPVVYIIAHGSSSANNPHHGAHDCGACSGRPGSVNARVMAFMINHPKVRELLAKKGIHIPAETQFVGALHDTAGDQIAFYDESILTTANTERHLRNADSFEKALDLNAKERSRRFASISSKMSIRKIRKAILDRSVSLFEPRPELGHGTNTLCIVGRRGLTKSVFLDRRAFLNSYDYRTDREGKLLTGLMKPLGPVCGGINLEYYFSRVDNHKLGAGTKLPHNVMGLFGVANSSDGDLRPGLPVQMIEVHDPVRLLIIVEHFPEIVLRTIQSVPEMYQWFINEWVHLVSVNPENGKFYYFQGGEFIHYKTLGEKPGQVGDIHRLIESAKEMETNHILDATRENLPVYLIN
ncbi:MAG: DUF2309 domain-containing protein [Gemmatimonadaceae bacterium]|nr:DUF2309 domain-containing protein [Chitinophagaceae bacterium]